MKKLLLVVVILTANQLVNAQPHTIKSLGNKTVEKREMIQGATVNGRTAFSQLWISTDRFKSDVEKAESEMKAKGFKKVDKATFLITSSWGGEIEYDADAKTLYVAKLIYSSFDGDMTVYWKHPETPGIGTKNTSSGYNEHSNMLTMDEYTPASNATVKIKITTNGTAPNLQYTAVQLLIFKKKK